jgi:hypothetical protein
MATLQLHFYLFYEKRDIEYLTHTGMHQYNKSQIEGLTNVKKRRSGR